MYFINSKTNFVVYNFLILFLFDVMYNIIKTLALDIKLFAFLDRIFYIKDSLQRT